MFQESTKFDLRAVIPGYFAKTSK